MADYIQGQFEAGRRLSRSDVIVSSKSGLGYRPIHTIPFQDQVFYQAIVDSFRPELPEPDRSDAGYDTFRNAPLTVSDSRYVVRTDVSAFYQYVDHRALELELVGATGNADLAAAVAGFLDAVTGQGLGLPQNNGASHVLADLFVDAAERRLIRLGYSVFRYNDDFALAAPTQRVAHEYVRDFDRVLREIGLTPNDDKTMILRVDQYSDWIGRALDRRRQLTADLDIIDIDDWLTDSSEYDDEELLDELDEELEAPLGANVSDEATWTVLPDVRVQGSLRALESWKEFVDSESRDPLERYVHRQLARDAIRLLRKHRSAEGLRFVQQLVTFEPQMTHTVSRYLAALAGGGDQQVINVVSELVTDPHRDVSAWQALWLLEPLWRGPGLSGELVQWVRSITRGDSLPDVLRARAAFALARHGAIDIRELGQMFNVLGEPARPDLVAAIATAGESAAHDQVKSVAVESPIYGLIVDFVLR